MTRLLKEAVGLLVPIALMVGGAVTVIRGFVGREFYLVNLGGMRGPRVPNWS